jgi:acyl-CoA reductase-like NAD-dependent aldehyde dehydrogenase
MKPDSIAARIITGAEAGATPEVAAELRSDEARASARAASGRDPLTPASLALAAHDLRASLRAPIETDRIAGALQETFVAWQDRGFAPRRHTLSEAATAWSWSVEMLDESLDALLRPFSAAAIRSLAARLEPRRQVFGFIMPGNVLGAGLHEVCQAMLAGAAIIVKPSSKEPRFFAAFAGTVGKIDAAVGSRIRVLNWGRDRAELTAALNQACETVVAFGSDETLSNLAADARVIGFGSRASGALIASDCDLGAVADAVARDVSLFEQQGCLSPHHVFVENRAGAVARGFAQNLARSLDKLRYRIAAPARLALNDAAAIRSARENARWRRIGGGDVEMWEGTDFGWTVIYDHAASFRLSPGHRTAYVTPIRDLRDFKMRLAPVAGRLEAFALADPAGRLGDFRRRLTAIGVSYVCAPGEMQSPPLDWRHGGGAFLGRVLKRED